MLKVLLILVTASHAGHRQKQRGYPRKSSAVTVYARAQESSGLCGGLVGKPIAAHVSSHHVHRVASPIPNLGRTISDHNHTALVKYAEWALPLWRCGSAVPALYFRKTDRYDEQCLRIFPSRSDREGDAVRLPLKPNTSVVHVMSRRYHICCSRHQRHRWFACRLDIASSRCCFLRSNHSVISEEIREPITRRLSDSSAIEEILLNPDPVASKVRGSLMEWPTACTPRKVNVSRSREKHSHSTVRTM